MPRKWRLNLGKGAKALGWVRFFNTLAFCGQKYPIGAGVSRDLTDAKTMASFASHHLLLLYQEYKF